MKSQQQKVYQAEWEFQGYLDSQWLKPVVDLGGIKLVVPSERKFGAAKEVDSYIGAVCSRLGATKPAVVAKSDQTSAHYEPWSHTIAVPSGAGWALREIVVLHELAHAISKDNMSAGHGPKFAATLTKLVDVMMGSEANLLLTILYSKHGVEVQQ